MFTLAAVLSCHENVYNYVKNENQRKSGHWLSRFLASRCQLKSSLSTCTCMCCGLYHVICIWITLHDTFPTKQMVDWSFDYKRGPTSVGVKDEMWGYWRELELKAFPASTSNIHVHVHVHVPWFYESNRSNAEWMAPSMLHFSLAHSWFKYSDPMFLPPLLVGYMESYQSIS